MLLDIINERVTKLKQLFNVLHLINNNVIAKQEKEKVIADIKKILEELNGLAI